MRKRLLRLGRAIGARKPTILANQLLILIDGAYSTVGTFEKHDAVNAKAKAAEALIDATIGVFGSPPRSSDRICKKMLSIEESLRPNGLARIQGVENGPSGRALF